MGPRFSGLLAVIVSAALNFPAAPAFCQADGSYNAVPSVQAAEAAGTIDFETYQRNIDDMFQIALMSNPTVDYGINSVIIDLNRKIAENPASANPLISLGHVYRVLGRPSEANRFYEKALLLDPDNFHVNVFSALTSAENEDLDMALERLKKAVELNPADSYARLGLSRILMFQNKDDEAIQNFQELLEFNPDNRQAVFVLSLIYQKKGEYDKALKLLEELKRKQPEDQYISYHLGALHLADDKPEEALKHWDALFKQGVRDVQFLFNLAIAYIQNGDGEKAARILEHLNFFFPNETDVEILMAESFRQLGKLDEAERRYRLILAEERENLTALMGLAQVLELLGKSEEKDAILKEAGARAREESSLQAAKEESMNLIEESFNGKSSAR